MTRQSKKTTAAEVRHRFAEFLYLVEGEDRHDEEGARFDRWIAEHDAALIEGLADEIVVGTETDVPDDFLRGFDAGSDAVYAALREKARQRRGQGRG